MTIASAGRRTVATFPSAVGLEMLFDAATVPPTDGGVSVWQDRSGNQRHATQAAQNSRPTLVQSGVPAVLFDGVDDSLILPRLDLPACTVLAAVSRYPMPWQPYATILQILQSSTTKDAIRLQLNDHSGDGPILAGAGGDGTAGYSVGGTLSLRTPRLLTITLSAGVVAAWDGATSVSLTTSTTKVADPAGSDSRIGAAWKSPGGSVYRHWCGAISGLAVYSRVLSSDERAQWLRFAATRGWT